MNHTLDFLRAVSLTALAVTVTGAGAWAQGVASGDLLVFQVGAGGTGSTALTSAATADYLSEYTTAVGQTQPVRQFSLTTTSSGSATSEGGLTLSQNGQYASFVGYNAAVGTAAVANTSNATVARVAGSFNLATGAVDTSTALTDAYSGNNIRGSVTTDGSAFYTAGAPATGGTDAGVHYAADGATTSTQLTGAAGTLSNARRVSIFNNQLYASSGTSPFVGISTVGTGLPTTGPQTATLITSGGGTSPYDFFFTNATTLYVADSGSTAGLEKFSSSDGGKTFSLAYNTALSGVTGFVQGATGTQFYAVTPSTLYSVVDTGTKFTTGVLATAPTNAAFRDLVFSGSATSTGAMPEPGVLPLVAEAGLLVAGFAFARRRRKA